MSKTMFTIDSKSNDKYYIIYKFDEIYCKVSKINPLWKVEAYFGIREV